MTRAEFSKRTKLKAFIAACGLCRGCGNILRTGNIEFHHDKECTYGGDAKLENCVVLCRTCHKAITKKQAPVIAKSNRIRAKHLGIKRKSSFQTNKIGKWKKKISGEVVLRAANPLE